MKKKPMGSMIIFSIFRIPKKVFRTVFGVLFFVCLIFWGGAERAAQAKNDAEPKLRMEAVPSKVYQGESFRLLIHLDNAFDPAPPNVDYLKEEFNLEYLGAQNRNSSRITIINGVTTKEENRGITYNYRLTPKDAGKIQILSPEMEAEGKTITAAPVTINVIPPSEQDLVRIEMTANADALYPLTPFQATLSVYVKEISEKYADVDPILFVSRQDAAPELTLTWAQDENLPAGTVPATEWQKWITDYQNADGGFAVNHLQIENPLSLLSMGARSALFYPKPVKVTRTDSQGNSAVYWRYDFTRSLTAEQTGPLVFDAASLKGVFVESDEDGNLAAKDLFVLSNPLTVRVKDVPEEGRPDDYIGAFGKFRLTAETASKSAKVGEAMTLTVTLAGEGSVLNVKSPDLEKIPEIAKNFKIYPPTEEIRDGQAKWTWSLRPLQAGSVVFPPLTASYFDVKTEKFVSLASSEIPLEIEANGEASSQTFIPSSPSASPAAMARSASGIFGNLTKPGINGGALTLRRWGLAAASMAMMTLLWGAGIRWRRLRSVSPKTLLTQKIREGREEFQNGLADGKSGEKAERSAGYRRMIRAFLIPVASEFSSRLDAVSQTQIEAFLETFRRRNQMKPASSEDKTLSDLGDFIRRLNQAQYGAEEGDLGSVRDGTELYERWERLLLKYPPLYRDSSEGEGPENFQGGKPKWKTLGGILLVVGVLGLVGCSPRMDRTARDEFAEAIRLFDEADRAADADVQTGETQTADDSQTAETEASSAEKFRKAAAIYEGLRRRGIESGAILYNQGNAYLRAQDAPNALASWRRAEKYMPTNPYLKANIETLRPADARKKGWAETLFFWQTRLSWNGKWILSLVFGGLSCVGWGTVFFFQGRKRKVPGLKRTATVGLILFILLAASLGADVRRFDLGNHGILRVENGTVRKGASARYAPLFLQPLPRLTEFQVCEERAGWVKVRLGDGQEGWLPVSDVLIY